jgi:hypothetical protein
MGFPASMRQAVCCGICPVEASFDVLVRAHFAIAVSI